MKLTDLETWLQAEHAYRSMRLYNIVYMNWVGTMVVPTLFAACSGITILLYITFRPSGLPILVYCWFPIVAVVAMFSIAWLCYDAVIIKRKADEALGHLQSRSAGFLRWCQRSDKKELLSRGRALQPAYLALGEFTEFTLEVPMNVWDEVLNQLLFLLSL